jgi:hypothetical protein
MNKTAQVSAAIDEIYEQSDGNPVYPDAIQYQYGVYSISVEVFDVTTLWGVKTCFLILYARLM